MPSIGSVNHAGRRCKPCAFYHTKGCGNERECLFCHLCSPGEKQRRRRLQHRLCEKFGGQSWSDRRFKAGHSRQASGTSTATGSTFSSASRYSHSRQSSGSSVTVPSAHDSGMVGAHMHMPQQMVPVFFHQHVVPLGNSAEKQSSSSSDSAKDVTAENEKEKEPSSTAQTSGDWSYSAQMGYWPVQGGWMPYAVVPMVLPVSANMDPHANQAYYPQPQHSQVCSSNPREAACRNYKASFSEANFGNRAATAESKDENSPGANPAPVSAK